MWMNRMNALPPGGRKPVISGRRDMFSPMQTAPWTKKMLGEHVYLQIINGAKDYVYINTPYLIVDDSVLSALCLAAKSGVDVRIVTPHRWDKWLVHMTTRSYYRELVKAGVKIYEYTSGFIHAKTLYRTTRSRHSRNNKSGFSQPIPAL